MTERAAHLIDHVLPRTPAPQWVLSLLFELRYRLAWDRHRCRAVLAVYTRALPGFYRKRARASGHRGRRTGTFAVVQRFGGALNLNVHLICPPFRVALSTAVGVWRRSATPAPDEAAKHGGMGSAQFVRRDAARAPMDAPKATSRAGFPGCFRARPMGGGSGTRIARASPVPGDSGGRGLGREG